MGSSFIKFVSSIGTCSEILSFWTKFSNKNYSERIGRIVTQYESYFERCIHLSVRWETTSRNFVDFGVGVKTETKFDMGDMPGCGDCTVVN